MDATFHYDPIAYHEQVADISDHVVSNDDAIPTFAPRLAFEDNSYHQVAIRKAEQDRLRALYPRLYL